MARRTGTTPAPAKLDSIRHKDRRANISTEELRDFVAKVATARTLWVPAINNHGGFGRWAFIRVDDFWNSEKPIRSFLEVANG